LSQTILPTPAKWSKLVSPQSGTMPENLPCCEDIEKVEKMIQKISNGSNPKKIK